MRPGPFRLRAPIVLQAAPAAAGGSPILALRATPLGAAPIERVKTSRLGRSLTAAALLSVAATAPALAQAARSEASTHTVKRGDTLWDIARRYLGDPYLWPEIYRINTDQIEDPHWIYPGEILRLTGRTVAAAPPAPEQAPVAAPVQPRSTSQSVFSSRQVEFGRNGAMRGPYVRPRVRMGDILRAPFYGPLGGPRDAGLVMFGADIPGIDKSHSTTNFQLYDRLLMLPPAGSAAAVRDRFMAYELGSSDEDVGTIVIPVALLQVVRAPRNDEPAIVVVRELYGSLDADTKVIALDTTGAGVTARPVAVPQGAGQSTKLLDVHTNSVLPSLGSFVLFGLSARDGMHIGDEVAIYRPHNEPKGDDGPSQPEVAIATAQVVRVTPYGSTALVTAQEQPAIKKGESVRVVARMP